MINKALTEPKSIVVVGGSDDLHKPGGKILSNIINGAYKGDLYVSNPKSDKVQGIKSYKDLKELPPTEAAVLAIPAKFCSPTVKLLAEEKGTRAFIIISAGFSETSEEGATIEREITEIVNKHNAALIGPNGIGVLTPHYSGVFTSPVPKLDPQGADFISGSGATAVFIMELGIPDGLSFANVFSVGNSAQIGAEDVLEYLDLSFDAEKSSKIKLLYLEQITKPQKLLKHARSLISKGCRIAAVKAGSSDAGSRAASSHTGALAGSDAAVDALFKKAGIVRCSGRQELITFGKLFTYPELRGKNIGIITHAGGPAVMLTDALEKGGLNVPKIENPKKQDLLAELYPGSSADNPIDFLATGTAKQLATVIDYCQNYFDEIDAIVVIFGTPGLTKVYDAYRVLSEKIKTAGKPIYPVLPSVGEAADEINEFIANGHSFFPEEVLLGNALAKYANTPPPCADSETVAKLDFPKIRKLIDEADSGYLSPEKVQEILDATGIPRAEEAVLYNTRKIPELTEKIAFPWVMKVVGPVHKSDMGGVVLGIKNLEQAQKEAERMMKIKGAEGLLIQPFLSGTELFAGMKYEENFGHLVLAGLGGIFIEVFKDSSAALAPVSEAEADRMLKSLKSYPIIEGTRGQAGINRTEFKRILLRLSALAETAPEILELDLNPLLGKSESVTAVDARILIDKNK